MASVNNDPVSTQHKILLVDDREDNLLSIAAILAHDAYQFYRAYSGDQALKILLTEFDFAMILMDVKMPVLNGFETATLIYEREKLKHIPIIFITANNYGDENIFKGYKAGGIDYIFKPINPEVLRAKVSVFIDLYLKNALLFEQEQKLSIAYKRLEKEISDLKASEEKMRQLKDKLKREITTIESLVASSNLPIARTEFEQIDLNKLFNELLDEMSDEIKEKMATVLIEPLPNFKVSPILMRPLFQNLVRSALHYRKNNINPVINIRPEIGELGMTVNSENSKGKKYSSIIFEDKSVARGHKNTDETFIRDGLSEKDEERSDYSGLDLCRKIMEKHDGFIFVKEEVSDLTIFIVSFPMAK